MFIMNTRSTIAVMSNSGVSSCGLRGINWSKAESLRPKLAVCTARSRSASSLKKIEHANQPGAKRVLKSAHSGAEAGKHEIERNGSSEPHRRADQGDAD